MLNSLELWATSELNATAAAQRSDLGENTSELMNYADNMVSLKSDTGGCYCMFRC
jgi:hypothetical protein